jgi:hypothetical protein
VASAGLTFDDVPGRDGYGAGKGAWTTVPRGVRKAAGGALPLGRLASVHLLALSGNKCTLAHFRGTLALGWCAKVEFVLVFVTRSTLACIPEASELSAAGAG